MQLWPENTLASFREAIRLGAHMIELDVRLSKDGQPMVIHDQNVDRTTNGTGNVAELVLDELKQFHIRDPKRGILKQEHIPTLAETLDIMPRNIWLNLHLKGKADRGGWWSRLTRAVSRKNTQTSLPATVTRMLAGRGRLHQAFLACGGTHAGAARHEHPQVQICYLLRGSDSQQAVREAVEFGAQFIQLSARRPPTTELISLLKQHGIRITYGFADSTAGLRQLFAAGIEFPLVNNIHELMPHAAALGLEPVS